MCIKIKPAKYRNKEFCKISSLSARILSSGRRRSDYEITKVIGIEKREVCSVYIKDKPQNL